jgi:hypothetical protein
LRILGKTPEILLILLLGYVAFVGVWNPGVPILHLPLLANVTALRVSVLASLAITVDAGISRILEGPKNHRNIEVLPNH